MPRVKLPPGTPLNSHFTNSSGKGHTWVGAQVKVAKVVWSNTQFGKDFLQPLARYGLYGVAAFALVKVVSYANNVYTWWAGSKDSRERARLEKKLDRLNSILGPDVDLVGLIQAEHTRGPQRRRGTATSRTRNRSHTRNRSTGQEDRILSHMTAADKRALLRVAAKMAENDLRLTRSWRTLRLFGLFEMRYGCEINFRNGRVRRSDWENKHYDHYS